MTDVLVVPERSLVQRLTALRHANEIRSHRAQVKRRMKAREVQWRDVLNDPQFASAKVGDVLLAIPFVGRVKRDIVMRRACISMSKTVGGLSDRQRRALDYELGRFPSVRRVTMGS